MKQKRYALFLSFIAFAVYSPYTNAQIITTFAGTGVSGYSGDNNLATIAKLNSCTGVAVDGAGNVYIADKNNNVVRKVSTTGIITTFAGKDTAGYSGNGGQATAAKLNKPYSVATDAAGNVYIADYGNNVIRVVSTSGIINTYAGNDTAGYSGDNGDASYASLNGPEGIAIDGAGNLYIADANNNVIRKVDIGGVITTIAGNGSPGNTGDNGAATSARLHSPSGVAVDAFGDVFIADVNNNVVREVIDSTGIIVPYAGNYSPGHAGDGGAATAAQLYFPASVSVQGGSLYIADQGNNTIRRVDSLGMISTFAGTRTAGYTGDNNLPTDAELSGPVGVYADGWTRVYISDNNNNVIRVVKPGNAGVSSSNIAQGVRIYPNPTIGMLTIEIPTIVNNAVITVANVLGNDVFTTNTNAVSTIVNLGNIPTGNYTVKVVSGDKTYTNKIEVVK